jgi:DnaJ family protein A protein 2
MFFGGGGRQAQAQQKKGDVNTTKYYEIIGVTKTASQDEIRKHYRKLAAKLHPDKGGDKDKFSELQNAYEVLSDPKKKEVYDTYGEEGLKEGMGGGDDFDPFSMFFGGGGRQAQAQQKKKCKAKLVNMKIKLEDVYNGAKKTYEFSRRIVCRKCTGSGSANPNAVTKCAGCNGKGVKMVVQRMANILLQQQQTCPDCQGEGQVIKDKCKECKGEKVAFEVKTISVDIDKGIPDGHRYVLNEQGDEYPDIETGDVHVEMFIEKHPDFIRKGADLMYKVDISILQALTGVSFVINHLDGKKILIKSNPEEIIKPMVLKTVKELGMPFHNAPFRYGHLYIEFNIIFPEKLDEKEVKIITEILRGEVLNKNGNKMTDESVETYQLSDFKPEDENTSHTGGKKGQNRQEEDEDEDDDSHHRGHKTMNCQHQ